MQAKLLVLLIFFLSLATPTPYSPLHRPAIPPTYISPIAIPAANISRDATTILTTILSLQANPDPDLLRDLIAIDATYVSLTFDNPSLHRILPWAGTRSRVGSQAFLDTFTRVGLWWTRGPFQIQVMFGDGEGNVTAWGTFDVTSNTLGKAAVGVPWCCRARVEGGVVTYFQYMEDTFSTTETFWGEGRREFRADPVNGGSVWM